MMYNAVTIIVNYCCCRDVIISVIIVNKITMLRFVFIAVLACDNMSEAFSRM